MFWESGAARVGEEGADGWDRWVETRGESSTTAAGDGDAGTAGEQYTAWKLRHAAGY